jgi:hypothetical protein
MVIGSGIDNDYTLWNYIPHSLFVGFKTSVPTLFVGGTDHRVGIGTASPEAKLHVEGVIEVDQKIQADDSGGLELATDEGTTRLSLHDNGNVGIWTTSPAHALHVAGHEMIQGPDGFNSNGEQATLYLGDTNKYLRATYGGNTTLYSNDPLLIRTGADAEQLFLGTGGRVGIGTSTPGYKLDVNGDINVSGSYNVKKGGTNYTHPDYVFEPDYELMPLGELKEHVFAEKSLPNVISADDVRKNDGFKMDELLVQMLEKLEEQTLYIFQLEERIAALEQRR